MSRMAIFIVLIAAILITALVWTKLFAAEKSPLLPADVRAVFDKYAERYPQGRLDQACRIGEVFFLGIIVFPEGDELDARYVLVGKFKEWEPIAEFQKLPY